ncbi:MAG TPA: single-stranded DNA-binding protein, partial [Bacteroidia bacterium]|nr:single-stranded DNA-binding protein [Bacteroidia bacterium]
QLVGNLGQNPEIKKFDSGKKVANFTIACTESHTDKEGKKVETTQWFRATAWEGLATIAEKYMVKGKQVAISGKLVNRNWKDKDGKDCYSTEILVSDILLMGGKKD